MCGNLPGDIKLLLCAISWLKSAALALNEPNAMLVNTRLPSKMLLVNSFFILISILLTWMNHSKQICRFSDRHVTEV